MDDKGGDEDLGFGRNADWLLQFWVKAAESRSPGEKPFQVTVLVAGQWMSGEIIPLAEYLKATGFPDEIRASVNRAFLEVADRPPNYIHLKSVKVLQPGSKLTAPTKLTGVPLRISLSAVDGFLLGSMDEP